MRAFLPATVNTLDRPESARVVTIVGVGRCWLYCLAFTGVAEGALNQNKCGHHLPLPQIILTLGFPAEGSSRNDKEAQLGRNRASSY